MDSRTNEEGQKTIDSLRDRDKPAGLGTVSTSKRALVRVIDLLERRLLSVASFREDLEVIGLRRESSNDVEAADWNDLDIISLPTICLLFKLLGEAYQRLIARLLSTATKSKKSSSSASSVEVVLEYKRRCYKAYKSAFILAAHSLQPSSLLRIQCTYRYCAVIVDYQGYIKRSARMAERVFLLANDLSNPDPLSEIIVQTLQRLRDDFIDTHLLLLSSSSSAGAAANSAESAAQGNDGSSAVTISSIDSNNSSSGSSSSRARGIFDQWTRGNDQSIWSKFEEGDCEELYSLDDDSSVASSTAREKKALHSRAGYRGNMQSLDAATLLVKNLRREVTVVPPQGPVFLDSLPSGSDILQALDRIFRVYVRGYALAGQRAGGSTVELDGKSVSFVRFLLQGPYLSWTGFLCVLRDFSIAPVSFNTISREKRLSKALMQFLSSRAMPVAAPPLLLKEAAALFIECSRTVSPLLIIEKYTKDYEEIVNNRRLVDEDPWEEVTQWAQSDNWDIRAGLNFMQFIDCLGKCGVIAYSDARFRTIFPTQSERIQHFMSAHLGLTDRRRWQVKVDNKLKHIRSIISNLVSTKPLSAKRLPGGSGSG